MAWLGKRKLDSERASPFFCTRTQFIVLFSRVIFMLYLFFYVRLGYKLSSARALIAVVVIDACCVCSVSVGGFRY